MIQDFEKAKNLARAIVSDLVVYNTEKIQQGIKEDSLFEILRDEIKDGLDLYKARVDTSVIKSNLYFEAVLDLMLCSYKSTPSKIWS